VYGGDNRAQRAAIATLARNLEGADVILAHVPSARDGFLRRGGGVSCCVTDHACCPLVPIVFMAQQRVSRGRTDRGVGGRGGRGHAS
jgi:hypothetical protein